MFYKTARIRPIRAVIFFHVIEHEGHPLLILLVRLRAWIALGDSGVVAKVDRCLLDGTNIRLSDSGRAALLPSPWNLAVRSLARSVMPCLLASIWQVLPVCRYNHRRNPPAFILGHL